MKRKTSGVDDLIKTLVNQHGLTGAIDRALAKCWETAKSKNPWMWRTVYDRLKDMR